MNELLCLTQNKQIRLFTNLLHASTGQGQNAEHDDDDQLMPQ